MRKKVLIFIPVFPVLTETFIEREVIGLVKSRRADVSLLSIHKGCDFRHPYLEKVTTYRRANPLDFVLGLRFLFLNASSFIDAFRTVGFSHLYIFLKSIGYAHIFSQYSPDIIYSHFLSEPSTIAMICSKILNVPYGISAHARDVLEYPDLPKKKVLSAKFIAFCNKNAYMRAKELWGNKNSKLILSNHGIDMEDLELNEDKEVPHLCDNMIFCIGRLTEKKGINYLIDSAKILKNRGVDFCIYVAGGGDLFDEYTKIIEENYLTNNFVLLGNVPFKDVVLYMNKAKIYVQPSIDVKSGDSDGIPNGIIEASLLKKPIVTTNAGSIAEFIDDTNGYVVEQRSAEELAHVLEKILQEPSLSVGLVENAYKKANKMFNFADSIKRIEELLLK